MAADLVQMITDVMMALASLKQHMFLMIYCLWWLTAEACCLKVWNDVFLFDTGDLLDSSVLLFCSIISVLLLLSVHSKRN